MSNPSLHDVTRLINAVNAARSTGDRTPHAGALDAERQLDALFGVTATLAVYGSLAPGRQNHHIVAPLGGEWSDGVVEGDLSADGWGATLGYSAFRPRTGGDIIAVKLLVSPALRDACPELDRFEGPDYQRVLVPVFRADDGGALELHAVANIYALAATPPSA